MCSTRLCLARSVVCLLLLGFLSVLLNLLGSELLSLSPRELQMIVAGEDFIDSPGAIGRKVPVFLSPEGQNSRTPIVVWWTPFTGDRRIEKKCRLGSCLFTHSRTEQNNTRTKAFVYYGTDIDWKDLPLPRRDDQLWALLHEESPKNNWILASDGGISLFNLTSTCSRYSSYPLTTQFLHKLEWLEAPVEVETHRKSSDGLGLVMYLQSDCNPPSDRDSYVRELAKYVSVDAYGKCLHNRDLPEHLVDPLTFSSEEILSLVSKYKFTLAFENARCHDYVTEKFWRPLYAGSVPIVLGSPTIRDWAPTNHSIIVAGDFENPQELAKYLQYLDQNDREYERYLEFKRTGVTNPLLLGTLRVREWVVDYIEQGINFIEGFECYVCDRVHQILQLESEGVASPHLVASGNHYNCVMPEPSLARGGASVSGGIDREARSELWYWRYVARCSASKGQALRRAIAGGGTVDSVVKALRDACSNMVMEE